MGSHAVSTYCGRRPAAKTPAESQPSGFYLVTGAIVNIRWPEGESHVRAIQARLTDFQSTTPAARLFQAAATVFFPGTHAGFSSGPSVADELFQWPQRRNRRDRSNGPGGNKRSLRQRQRSGGARSPASNDHPQPG